jgi:predicted MPP superfamily phosphohydrolase
LLASDNLCWVSHLEADPAKVFQNPFHYLLFFSHTGLPARPKTVSCPGYGMGQFYYDCRLFFTSPPAVPRPLGHPCRSRSRRGSSDENLVQGNSKTPAIPKGLAFSVVLIGTVWNNHPEIREYSIEIPKKSSGIQQLKIAFVSDFHFRETTNPHLMERFLEKVNAANPDIVLIGGDVLEGDRQGEKLGEFEAQFRRLKPKYGVYGVLGNHDLHRANPMTFFNQAGIRLLQDTVEQIDNAFYLVGRNDGRSRGRKSIEELLRDCDRSLPVIVLEHRPTDLDNVSRSGADILLSGHTHNGQLFPVNFIVKRHYELSWGYKLKKGTHVFVTSGIQVWGPPVRTAGDSEILIVNVSFREDH